LTNWPDDDIRLYSWQITSATISIFCAVLLFQGFNVFLRKQLITGLLGVHHSDPYYAYKISLFQIIHCFVYLACIHFGTGFASGVICGDPDVEEKINDHVWVFNDALRCSNNTEVPEEDMDKIRAEKRAKDAGKPCTEKTSVFMQTEDDEIPVQKKQHMLMQKKRKTKALGMLFAHMAGFAAICSGTSMQQLPLFANEKYKLLAWVPVIINQIILRIAFAASSALREWQLERLTKKEQSTATVNKEKAKEGIETIRELMKEEVEESENDVSSLSMSYLTVNVIRFTITDALPNEEGEEFHGFHPEMSHVIALYLCGFLAVGFAVLQAIFLAKNSALFHKYQGMHRFMEAVLNATGMCFAWCLLWATKWICKDKLFTHEIMGRVSLAFVLTSFAAGSVFAVDKIADKMRDNFDGDKETLEFVEEIIRIIINSLGILVGFSWEHSFDGSVVGVSQMTPRPVEFELFLGIAVCILILPAWRDYILQKVMLIEDMMGKKRSVPEKTGENAENGASHS
jgi:hypothetical protein